MAKISPKIVYLFYRLLRCMKTKIRKITETGPVPSRVFGSSAFTDSIFKRTRARATSRQKGSAKHPLAGDIVFEIYAADVRPDEVLCLVGECDSLGSWQPERSQQLDDRDFPMWRITLPANSLPDRFEYKFIVRKREDDGSTIWEEGYNRLFDYFKPAAEEALQLEVRSFRNPDLWRGAGVAVPVFSLRSERSFGVGDFSDLKLMADWATETGQCVIQILPINDTTDDGSWRDSYPYRANSIFALNPIYLDIFAVGKLGNKCEQARFERVGRQLNALAEVDYPRVAATKQEYLRKLYKRQGKADFATDDYAEFYENNISWLLPYAVFSVLRDRFATSDFAEWGEWASFDEDRAKAFALENATEVGYWYFVQYHLDRQMRAARDYAHSRGVILKGDIPIGIGRHSVDAWASPQLFNMESSAGAPPDDFSIKGQNWGFPTYNWERMASDGYAWWRARFAKMADYFDAYRIDHILGFFRIWEIPLDAKSALLGHFSPAMPLDVAQIAEYGFRFDEALHTAPVSESEDVLFVEDPKRKGYFHPRITAHSTEVYASLSDMQKHAYNQLYDDFFYRRHNDFWRAEAMRKLLPLTASTSMLVCGEDLGMIPACVPDVMSELEILSLEVERMPKAYGAEFGDTFGYPYHSICTPSTHDMSNIRLWWCENSERTQRYYNEVFGLKGEAPAECSAELCEKIMRRQLAACSILMIAPLQDWLSIDEQLRRDDAVAERINDPSNPDQHWCYRMHLTLEELLLATEFNQKVKDMCRR